MESDTTIVCTEEQGSLQLVFVFDPIKADPAPATDNERDTEAALPPQQPAADTVIAPTGDLQTPTIDAVVEAPVAHTTSVTVAPTEPSKYGTDQESPTEPAPPGSSIQIKTGVEAMQGRTVSLYTEIAELAGLKLMDMHAIGLPILVDSKFVNKLRAAYMAADEKYQEESNAHLAGKKSDSRRSRRRAFDRARKEIGRALDDLVEIYAADELVTATGKWLGYLVYRLPDVLSKQIERGAKWALALPGGGRIIVDSAGFDVGRKRPSNSQKVQPAESQIQQAADRSGND